MNIKKLKNILFTSLLFILFMMVSGIVKAQACNDPYDPYAAGCDPYVNVPVDDGVYVLIGAVLLVGFYAFKTKKNVLPA